MKRKKVNVNLVAFFAIIIPLFLDYYLHLPLNRLAKKYYWRKEEYMVNNEKMVDYIENTLPKNLSIVTQNHLVAHLTYRDKIFLFWVRKREFPFKESPCSEQQCWWLFWPTGGEYLLVIYIKVNH